MRNTYKKLKINAGRLSERLEELAAIERHGDGSCCRIALTDADMRGRNLVVRWLREADLQVRIDRIGNIFGIRPGSEDGPPVMTGSHIDTVATGGRYDGAYGVLAGLEAVRILNEHGVATQHPLAVGIFTNEEGVRFAPDMMGSLVYAGGFPLEQALDVRAEDGARLGDELLRIGYAGDMECGAMRPRAYIELHIEQGPILHQHGEAIGVVKDLQGISWASVEIGGISNHAGTTPMQLRHDAGYCASRIGVFVRDLAQRMGGSQVGTVGSIRLVPNLVNVIARRATVLVDLRNTDADLLRRAEGELRDFLEALSREEGVSIKTSQLVQTPPVTFDDGLVSCIETAARELGHTRVRRMTSGAGHDAQMMARICPAAMIFVPSQDGISHNPKEFTSLEHLAGGADVLLHSLIALTNAG